MDFRLGFSRRREEGMTSSFSLASASLSRSASEMLLLPPSSSILDRKQVIQSSMSSAFSKTIIMLDVVRLSDDRKGSFEKKDRGSVDGDLS
jgi:hypothetical protein